MEKLGLALSGGGYRAAAFHLGTLNKLNELGIINKIKVLSTISGGSITGAAWCLHEGDYESFHSLMKEKLETKSVISHIIFSANFLLVAFCILLIIVFAAYLAFTSYGWLALLILIVLLIVLLKFQYNILPLSRLTEKAYDTFFYHSKTLKDFKENRPAIAVGSSNLHSGRPFTFSKDKMSDSYYSSLTPPIHFIPEGFPVSRAVAASTCVPFAFSPVFIARKFIRPEDLNRITPVLIDGGVYDNQGIQKLTQKGSRYETDIIITSDAGGAFRKDKNYPNTIALLVRTVDLFMYRIKAFQMQQNIYNNVNNKPIAYFSLDWDIDNLIPGFIDNLIKGQIPNQVLAKHNLKSEWLSNPKGFKNEVKAYLEKQVNFNHIKQHDLNKDEKKNILSISTNLTTLKPIQTNCLIRHAENLTELQIKLYLPFLLK